MTTMACRYCAARAPLEGREKGKEKALLRARNCETPLFKTTYRFHSLSIYFFFFGVCFVQSHMPGAYIFNMVAIITLQQPQDGQHASIGGQTLHHTSGIIRAICLGAMVCMPRPHGKTTQDDYEAITNSKTVSKFTSRKRPSSSAAS